MVRLTMKKAPTKNQYYTDPMDDWFESHPIIGGAILGVLLFGNIFLACLL
jgi:hypothetical protein